MMLMPTDPVVEPQPGSLSEKLSGDMLHFDANASYGIPADLHHEVAKALGMFCNPSAVHRGGQKARALLEEVRWSVKELIGAEDDDTLVFTSGATEANNSAVHGVTARAGGQAEGWLLYGSAEHASLVVSFEWYARHGWLTRAVGPVELRTGKVADIPENTIMAAFMAANNESGEIFDVANLFRSIKEAAPRCHAHCDMVQLVGKVPGSWRDLGADSGSISGHKIGSYPGVGALVLRGGVELEPFILGGPQEQRHRAGTENLPGIVSFGVMARKVIENEGERIRRMHRLTSDLALCLSNGQPGVRINFCDVQNRLPNTLSITVSGVPADDLVVALDIRGVAVSSGAACASGKPGGSHVLKAYGFPESEVRETIRVSITGSESDGDIARFMNIFGDVVTRMRKVGRGQ